MHDGPSPPPAGPASAPPPGPAPAALIAPRLWRRMACWLYEGLLTIGIAFVASLLFMPLRNRMPPELARYATQTLLFAVLGIYFGWCWSHGQTLAMQTWRIRIVDRHGQPPSLVRSLLRYVLSWLWFLPPLALSAIVTVYESDFPWARFIVNWVCKFGEGNDFCAFPVTSRGIALAVIWIALWALLSRLHPQRQFWHDVWAGTRLIDVRPSMTNDK